MSGQIEVIVRSSARNCPALLTALRCCCSPSALIFNPSPSPITPHSILLLRWNLGVLAFLLTLLCGMKGGYVDAVRCLLKAGADALAVLDNGYESSNSTLVSCPLQEICH
jgi:hypothetical protein